MIPINLSFSTTGSAPIFLSAIKAIASKIIAVGAIDQTVETFCAKIPRLCQRLPYAIVTMPHLRIDSKEICSKTSPFLKSPALHLVQWSIPAFPTAENRAWDLPRTQLGQPYDKPGREP